LFDDRLNHAGGWNDKNATVERGRFGDLRATTSLPAIFDAYIADRVKALTRADQL
jgi:hypothetical protein